MRMGLFKPFLSKLDMIAFDFHLDCLQCFLQSFYVYNGFKSKVSQTGSNMLLSGDGGQLHISEKAPVSTDMVWDIHCLRGAVLLNLTSLLKGSDKVYSIHPFPESALKNRNLHFCELTFSVTQQNVSRYSLKCE